MNTRNDVQVEWSVVGHGARRRVSGQTNMVAARGVTEHNDRDGDDGDKKGCPASPGIEKDDLRVDKIER